MARAIVNEIKDTRKNYIINGDMNISQRGTSFVSVVDTAYMTDRFKYGKVSSVAVHTASQDTDVPTFAQSGYQFQNSLRLNLTTPDTSIAPTDIVLINHHIEGYNWANIAQKTFTLSFWVKATLVGTYCVKFSNSGADRSYVAEYTINTTDTWEYKTLTISPSPTAGTWNYTSGSGINIGFILAAGSSYQTTANAWQTGNFTCTSNQVNGVNTGATNFRMTGVMINEGSTAPSFRLFSNNSFQSELSNCQRYFQVIDTVQGFSIGTTTFQANILPWVPMRTTPSLSQTAVAGVVQYAGGSATQSTIVSGVSSSVVGANGGRAIWANFTGLTNGAGGTISGPCLRLESEL